ncbi:MAG TPA: peptidyl-prolyl cis-trans isomerase [Terriglobia bacterium]|nr:peptidyl-prolyl cis-trans isomerase [Terriglobia bacterium]
MYRFFRRNRDKIMKYLLIFFLGIVSLGMVITLAPIPGGDTSNAQPNVLATLDGVNITTQEVQRRLEQQFRNSPLGSSSQAQALMARFAPTVLDQIVLDQAQVVEARRLGLVVSDQELAAAIRAYPGLSNNGVFIGADQYQSVIEQATGMTVGQFEGQLRESLLTDKLKQVVTDAVQVSPTEVHQEFLKRNEKAQIAYVFFDATTFTKDVQVTPQALEKYFSDNRDRYKVPQQRSLRYILVDADHVRGQVKVTDDDLRAYYSQHLDEYRVPERVKAAHILFKTTDKSPAEVAKIRQTAQDVLNQIQKGADFADMAKKYSEDTTASNGGDLGWIVRGQTVKEFEDTAFAMQPGQVSGLVTTTYGIHIIKVFDKQTAHVQTFDEVKGSIQATLEKQKLDQAQAALADQVEQAAKQDPQHFDAVAEKLGLKAAQTSLFKFGQAIPDLGVSEGLQNLAFQLTPGEVGQPVTIPKGIVITQLAQDVPAHTATLDEVRSQVEQDYRNEQAKVLASEKAKDLASKAKTEDFKKAASTLGLTVKESKDFTRQDTVDNLISGSELGDAFTLSPGQTSGVVAVGSNQIVFQVLTHTPADESTFATQQGQLRQELLDQKRSLAWEVYRQNLKQVLIREGKLKINPEALKQLVASYSNTSS